MMMRKAFSMITAIFVILVMATVAAFVLNLSGKMVQETSNLYRQEQAALLARSYTELAVMAVMNHDRNTTGTCVENIDGVVNGLIPGVPPSGSTTGGSGYNVITRIYYIGNDLPCSNSRRLNDNSTTAGYSSRRVTSNYKDAVSSSSDEIASILVDVYVQYKNPDTPTHWITFHRRTLQKI